MSKQELLQFIEDQVEVKELPDFKAGDTITIQYKIREGNKERIQNFQEGDVVPVGAVIAIVSINGDDVGEPEKEKPREEPEIQTQTLKSTEKKDSQAASKPAGEAIDFSSSERFYSPLVKNIAKTENISIHELNSVPGSGKDKRVTKNDLLQYIEDKKSGKVSFSDSIAPAKIIEAPVVTAAPGDEVIGMDRMRRLIADHMVMSKQVSPHVTMFHEVDMTKVALWRNRIKEDFLKREGGKLTFTPIFIEVAARALRDYPLINASVDGYNFIKRKKCKYWDGDSFTKWQPDCTCY
jgi:2-oxoglutarate dehydrogenase E2 component (dihydrolipoamide succinyltransferase)